jgi:VanZ family protein
MVGQQGGDLVVRLRRSVDTFNGVPPFVVTNVFNNLDRHAFFISVKPGMLSVSVDGITKLTAKLPDHALDTWAHDYRLILGNEITFDRPWLGVIREATIAVNGRRLDYLANGALTVPAIYYLQPQSDRTQLIPFYRWSYSPGAFKDWAVNFFGFIPLGFLFIVLYPRWSRVWRIGLVCLGVSLVIETMQLFLPWRHPGVEDLILNTLGGATGAWAGIKYWQQGEYDPTSR